MMRNHHGQRPTPPERPGRPTRGVVLQTLRSERLNSTAGVAIQAALPRSGSGGGPDGQRRRLRHLPQAGSLYFRLAIQAST